MEHSHECAITHAPPLQRAQIGQQPASGFAAVVPASLWNLAVFGGRLPPDLPLVWNPRLVATAGQVLDDGSLNSMKTAKDQ
eukprot:scaffold62616_cov20-Tisochrysis_lutea.AAC.1